MPASTLDPPPTPSRWRTEPFRLFFPLAVVFGSVGVGHWAFYLAGWIAQYSCLLHGLLQTQAFLIALALGFLLTAVPRRTQTAPPSRAELGALVAALVVTAVGTAREQWPLAESGYVVTLGLLVAFAVPRFAGRAAGRRPPAAFVLIPMGIAYGVGGAVLIGAWRAADLPPWTLGFGRLLVEQGTFLCFAIGAGSLVLPLMGGSPPPADLGSDPRETRRAAAYAATGAILFLTFVAESRGWPQSAALVRAAVVAIAFAAGAGAWRPPAKPGLHRRLARVAVWLMPLGLLLSAIFPDYRVPSLHVTFIGGFSLLGFAVATHVTLAHLDEPSVTGSPRAVKVMGTAVLLATVGRMTADWSHTYFEHLGWSAWIWIGGAVAWGAWLGPKWLRR